MVKATKHPFRSSWWERISKFRRDRTTSIDMRRDITHPDDCSFTGSNYGLLRLDLLKKHKCTLDTSNGTLHIGQQVIKYYKKEDFQETIHVVADRATIEPMPSDHGKSQKQTESRPRATQFICHYGVTLSIHTDQGRDFDCWLFQELCKFLKTF